MDVRPLLILLLFTCAVIGDHELPSTVGRKKVGCLVTRWHNVNGTVFIKNKKELFVKNFNYDGQGLGVYFNIGKIIMTNCKVMLMPITVSVVCLWGPYMCILSHSCL